MFNALRREIQEILGDGFEVFFGYNTNDEDNEKILDEYRNVGVLYINYGDLRLLPNSQGLTGSLQLDMMLSIKDGVEVESVVSKPLFDLIAHHNGQFESYSDDDDNGITYSYVLNYHAPTSSGEEYFTTAGNKYVIYSLPIDVVVANKSLMLGEQFIVEIELDGEFVPLTNTASAVLMPKLTPDTCTYIDDGDDSSNGVNTTKSSAIARVWGFHVECYIDLTNELHKAIYNALDKTPERTWNIRYKPNAKGFEYTTRKVLFHDSTATFPRGQFAVLIINMCEAV